MNIDKLFKPAILVLAVIFLLIFGLQALKGRYELKKEVYQVKNKYGGYVHTLVFDTLTGNLYTYYGEKIVPPPETAIYVPYKGPAKPETEGEQH
ncbi:MAG: hypothetical protein ACLPT6_00230 [Desulfobaccales bacterium]